MDFRLLGPLEIVGADGRVALSSGKQRVLLAVLLTRANETVSADALVDALWGGAPPPTAIRGLHNQVSALRKSLGDGRLLTRAPGYALRVEPSELDLTRFERLVAEAQGAEPVIAASKLREALALWRGAPLEDMADEPFAQHEIERLGEMRLAALERRIDADLACGRHGDLVGELHRLTRTHPWRESFHAQRMLALYRSGRQADALEAYRQARQALVTELGIEPGPGLQAVHQSVLRQDPQIDAPQPADPPVGAPRLPALPNRTLGREALVDAIERRLATGSPRVLTLIGPGGVGKTRVALEAARATGRRYGDGACFVSLSAVQAPDQVPISVMRELGIVSVMGESPEQAVTRYLACKQLLLVLDNCEHVLDTAPFIAAMVAACPSVTVLATSREPLRIQAEECHPVPPLAAADAVALFAERARARHGDLELGAGDDVAEICRRVDGLPLAIEIAAARYGLLTAAEISARLGDILGTFGTAARDAPTRQKTLRATIDWSHALLDPGEQACFARLAVFVGGATVEAAEAVTGAEAPVLDRLLAKSLLSRTTQPDGRSRLTMLETVRSYARERFAVAADDLDVRERHFRYFIDLARSHGTEPALWGVDRSRYLAVLDAEVGNLHAALRWAVAERPDAGRALALCEALGCYWLTRDRYEEAVNWIDRALSLPGAAAYPVSRVRVLCTKIWALHPLGRGRERPAIFEAAAAIAQRLRNVQLRAEVAYIRALVDVADHGRSPTTDALVDDAVRLAEGARDEWTIAMAAFARAIASPGPEELPERLEHAAALLERSANHYQLANLLASGIHLALAGGSDDYAAELVDRALPAIDALDSPYLRAHALGNAGSAWLLRGDIDAARGALRQATELCRDLVVLPWASELLAGLAAIAVTDGSLDRAARIAGAAAAHRYGLAQDEVDDRRRATFLEPARVRRGAEAWDAAERDGAALDFAEAIAYALAAAA